VIQRTGSGIVLAHNVWPGLGVVGARGSTCSYSLFGRRGLASGWSLVRSTFDTSGASDDCLGLPLPFEADDEPSFQPRFGLTFKSHVRTTLGPGSGLGCRFFPINISRITLRGPDNRDWREAFRTSVD